MLSSRPMALSGFMPSNPCRRRVIKDFWSSVWFCPARRLTVTSRFRAIMPEGADGEREQRYLPGYRHANRQVDEDLKRA